MSGARAAPFQATPVRAETACGHSLSFGAERDAAFVGGEVPIELIVASVPFVERNDGGDRARAEQVVSRIVVVSRVADEGGERQFGIELAGAIESLYAVDAVVLFGLSREDEDREIKGRRGGGQFIESVAVNIAFTIRVPSPGSETVGVEAGAIATIDALFVAIAEFAA